MSNKNEVSNKTLGVLLAAVIVFSLGGTIAILIQNSRIITGLSTDTAVGTAQVTIQGAGQIDIINNTINFGEGYVAPGNTSCILDSGINANSNTCSPNGTWPQLTDQVNDTEFVIRNSGNVNVSLDIKSASNPAVSWIGGTSPQYKFQSRTCDNTGCTGGCANGTITSWTDVPGSAGTAEIACSVLRFGTSNRDMEIDLLIEIPADAPPGGKTDTLTFTGTEVS